MLTREKTYLIEICKEIYNRKMVRGTGGNISLRTGNSIIITPSGYSLNNLKLEDIVEMDFDGNIIYEGKPSSESPFHLAIYKEFPEINAVIHTHSFYSVCVSILEKENKYYGVIPPYIPSFVVLVGKVPLAPYAVPGSKELSNILIETLKEYNSKAALLQNHGLVTLGKNLNNALELAEEIEESAKIHILLNGNGRILSAEEVKGILDNYNIKR